MRLFKKKIADSIEDQIVKTIVDFNTHMKFSDSHGYAESAKARKHQSIGMGIFATGGLAMAGSVGALAISLSVAPALLTGAAIGGLTTFGVALLGAGGVALGGLAYTGIAKLAEKIKSNSVESDPNRESKLMNRFHDKITSLLSNSDTFTLKDIDVIKNLSNSRRESDVEESLKGYKSFKQNCEDIKTALKNRNQNKI